MKTAVAATVIAFPLMYRNARAAFELVDPDLIYAARTLGMSGMNLSRRACRTGCAYRKSIFCICVSERSTAGWYGWNCSSPGSGGDVQPSSFAGDKQ